MQVRKDEYLITIPTINSSIELRVFVKQIGEV